MLTTDQIASGAAAVAETLKPVETALQGLLKAVHEHNHEAKGPQLNPGPLTLSIGGLLSCAEHLVKHSQENTQRLTPPAPANAPAAPAPSAVAEILKGLTAPSA
jgi:hypothetical protein